MRSMLHIASKTLIFCLNTDYHMVRNKLSGCSFFFVFMQKTHLQVVVSFFIHFHPYLGFHDPI